MHHAQVTVYESDSKLTDSLRDLSRERSLLLREVRQEKACLNLLRRAGSGVLVLKVGRDLEREMALLERAAWLFPRTAVIVVGDTDYPALASLAWDLGAHYVLFPPLPREILPELVRHLLLETQDNVS